MWGKTCYRKPNFRTQPQKKKKKGRFEGTLYQNETWMLRHLFHTCLASFCEPDISAHIKMIWFNSSYTIIFSLLAKEPLCQDRGMMNDGISRRCSVTGLWQDAGESSISRCKSVSVAPPPHPSLWLRAGLTPSHFHKPRTHTHTHFQTCIEVVNYCHSYGHITGIVMAFIVMAISKRARSKPISCVARMWKHQMCHL